MRSDKYNDRNRDSRFDTRSYDRWEETQMLFQSRNKEKEELKKRKEREEAYREYLAMREHPNANRSPEEDVKTYTRQKRKKQKPILESYEEEEPSRGPKKQQKQQKPKKKRKGKAKRIVCLVALLLAAVAVAGVMAVMGLVGKVGSLDIDSSNLGIDPQVAKDLKDYQNIALLGVDARDMDDYKNCRTDAIIILSLDKKNDTIRQISVYRDTYLHVNEKRGYDKITNVHAYEGTTGTLHSLNENLDLNIEEAVVVNWKAVADAIDGLGGIDIKIQESEIDEMNKYIADTQKNIGGSKKKIKKAGMQTLNGNQAVTYARIRKDSAKGDYRRNERMKLVVSATVEKAKKTSPLKLHRIANEVLPQIKTNMSSGSLMKVMLRFISGDMTDSTGWPFVTQGWTNYNGAWCGPPVTLKSNVEELHEKYFGQLDYEPTETVQDLSAEISRRTGYY